jgi:SOS regulatory protein LexA
MRQRIDLRSALVLLRQFYRQHRRSPSVSEIAGLFHYRSKNAAFWLVGRLVDKGILKKDAKGQLHLDSLGGVRLLGSIQAGFPSPAEEELVDTLSLDEYLIKHPEQTFLIKVTGDSMIDAGICEGDLVLVERGRTPRHRDIVIAQIDHAWTMKYYEKQGSQVSLAAANKKYPPIKPKQELVIGGVVVGVIRKYK